MPTSVNSLKGEFSKHGTKVTHTESKFKTPKNPMFGFQSTTMITCVQASELRIENHGAKTPRLRWLLLWQNGKGQQCCSNRIPQERLERAWLQEHVGLSISGCLGPCSLNNVTLMMNGNERIWLGELGTTEHYEALIEWAKSISNDQKVSELPDLLVSHQFKPK